MPKQETEQEIIYQAGHWQVNDEGDILCPLAKIHITFDRLEEQNWFVFAIIQGWNLNEFMPAFFEACRQIGKDSVQFDIDLEPVDEEEFESSDIAS